MFVFVSRTKNSEFSQHKKIENEMNRQQILNLFLDKDNPSHPLQALISNCKHLPSTIEK